MALFLLEKGADPHLRNNKKRNAIHLAAYHNMPEAIKALVLKGADVNAKVYMAYIFFSFKYNACKLWVFYEC